MNPVKASSFLGINNRLPIDRLRPDKTVDEEFVHDAVNVDMTREGTFQRRPGATASSLGSRTRSLKGFRSFALFARDDKLMHFDGLAAVEIATLPSKHSRVAYALTARGAVWTDGYTLNLVEGKTSRLLTPSAPNPVPTTAVGVGGALNGTYRVMFAAVFADGTRSAWTTPSEHLVPDGGRLEMTAPPSALATDIFITAADGETFYHEGRIFPGATTYVVASVQSAGEPIAYQALAALPGGRIIAEHLGRMLSASGRHLSYSGAWTYGLHRPAHDYIALPEDITLVAPTAYGVYLATLAKTYWIAGTDISAASMKEIAPYGAVKGTLADRPNSKDLLWFTPRGPVSATPEGATTLLQDENVLFPEAAAGAAILRESNGLTQLITSLSKTNGGSASAVVGCYMDAKSIKGP